MKNREIGHIISKGGSVKDIQQVVPKFPSNPTKETFIKMGYKESTAKRYISLLKQNAFNKALDKVEDCAEVEKDVIHSQNANYDNILVDTCALTAVQGRSIIESAKQVTFIFATLEEMDKKDKQNKKGTKKLKKYIKEYTSKILKYPNKYMLSALIGIQIITM